MCIHLPDFCCFDNIECEFGEDFVEMCPSCREVVLCALEDTLRDLECYDNILRSVTEDMVDETDPPRDLYLLSDTDSGDSCEGDDLDFDIPQAMYDSGLPYSPPYSEIEEMLRSETQESA